MEGRYLCQTCEMWKAMISVTVWEGGSTGQDASRRTATVGAITLDELRQMLPWAIATALRAADLEPTETDE